MAKQGIPAEESFSDMKFPLAGIDLSAGFGMQKPRPMASGDYGGTTPIGQNVRAYEPGTARARGGQRPGLKKYITTQVNGTALIQDIDVVVGVGYTPPGPGGGNPYLVQPVQSVGAFVSTTNVVTLATPVLSGSAVIVCTTELGNFPSITDAAGNVYTKAVGSSVGSSSSAIYYSTNVIGGFTAVTGTFTNVTNSMWVFEFGSLKATQPDDTGTGFGIGTTGSCGNVEPLAATTANGDIVFAVGGSTGGAVTINTPGWNAQVSTLANHFCLFQYAPVSGVVYDAALTWAISTTWSACLCSFKKA